MAWVLPVVEVLKWPLMFIGFGTAVGALSNLVGAATGQNPLAQFSATMMQSMVPLVVSVMPIVLMMNLMMSMVNSMFAPIQRAFMPTGVYF
jgi:hypothetical protein